MSAKIPEDTLALYRGLRTLDESLFPKTCRVCGRRYRSLDDFVEQTLQIQDSSGLTCFDVAGKKLCVGLFRNCVCGSTLLVPCAERRDESPAAARRRREFGRMLDWLRERGMDTATARRELLRFMRGETSRVSAFLHPLQAEPATPESRVRKSGETSPAP